MQPQPYAEKHHDPLSRATHQRDRGVVQHVAEAVHHGQAFLAYQPVVAANPPQKSAFFEGFIRITDGTGRVIPARDFISEIEDTELGRQVDCLALAHGLACLREEPNLRLSINLSAKSIGYPKWMRQLRRCLAQDPTLGQRIILEINEASAMMMPEIVGAFLTELRPHGVTFALDDFGRGATSLRHLRDLPFDIIKIDSHFVRNVDENSDNQVALAAIVALARNFDFITIAENVESQMEAETLCRLGVDCLQGHYFAPPSPRLPWQAEAAFGPYSRGNSPHAP